MTIRTYKVTLDTKNAIAPEPVLLRQGDKTGAVIIDATLMDNGSPVSLNGLTPMFKANTADGQAVIADSTGFMVTDSANGKFTYQVPNALSAIPGKITTAYFSFSDSSGSESTFDVAFVIKKAIDISKPQADDYITIIDGTIQSLQQKIDSMNTDIQTILDAYNQGDFYNKAETDSKDAATLASAKSYADTGDSATLASAKSYADTGVKLGTEWMPLTMLNGYTSSNAEYTVIGKLVLFSGYFSAPAGSTGAATTIFKLPFSVKSGQYWMAEAPNGNGGVGAPSANLFPMNDTTIQAWHAMDGKVYSLLGVWFTKI